MLDKVDEALLREDDGGVVPDGDGWFVVNVADARAINTNGFGRGARFEGESRFPGLGINVRVLEPGEPASMYHREGASEAFVVLGGECLAIIEDQVRPMVKGDFLFTPPGTAHVIVGAGDEACAVLMAGSREGETEIFFPASEVAAKHGASVAADTGDPRVAYEGTTMTDPTSLGLPW
jgi:uncharacterized cupin superfamily protein